MIRVIRLLVVFFSFVLSAQGEEISAFVQEFSTEQKALLDQFFHILIQDSFSGYVLYGDKPMCIESHPLPFESGAISGINTHAPILAKGMEFWKALKVSPKNKEFFFLIFDVDFGYRHLICINRRVFLQVVNENLSLFRYVLGPTLTAEKLLEELIEAKDQFYNVLKNDNVLLGILLGYGSENALLVSRKEYISDAFIEQRNEEFPFLAKSKRKALPSSYHQCPSLGFATLAEECEAIKEQVVISRNLKLFDLCAIPYFGCKPDSKKSRDLLKTYEKNRQEILKIVQKEDFLENVFRKLLSLTNKTISIPIIEKNYLRFNLPDKKRLTQTLAALIIQETKQEKGFHQGLLKAFLQGINAKEAGMEKKSWSMKQHRELYQVKKELENLESFEKADNYFKKLSNKKALNIQVPERLYFKILNQGEGLAASAKAKSFSFHYSYYIQGEEITDSGTIKEENLDQLIPGIAKSLVEMKRGEQRRIYIHPEYGYGEDTYFPPNAVIIADIQLIDFHEADAETTIALPCKLKKRNTKELLARCDVLLKEKFYINGVRFWDFIKRKRDFIDLELFEKNLIDKHQNKTLPKDEKELTKIITDLYCSLLISS